MKVLSLDHLVLTVADLERTVAFYTSVLGMRHQIFGDGRTALHFGDQKINLHLAGQELEPKALEARPGSADLCFLCDRAPEQIADHLRAQGVEIELGPVRRSGARGPLVSFYLRDPDGNLIEVSSSSV